jgi:hypothetical protein
MSAVSRTTAAIHTQGGPNSSYFFCRWDWVAWWTLGQFLFVLQGATQAWESDAEITIIMSAMRGGFPFLTGCLVQPSIRNPVKNMWFLITKWRYPQKIRKPWYNRFWKFKVYFEPKESFGTKSELEAKLKDQKWTFFFHNYLFHHLRVSGLHSVLISEISFGSHESWARSVCLL